MAAEKNRCLECDAPCCRNLVMPITRPKNRYELDLLKWYLHYDTVQIFISNHRWHLLIEGKCIYLSKSNNCTQYALRPEVCREHSSDSCETTGKWYDKIFSTPEQLEKFMKQKKTKRRK